MPSASQLMADDNFTIQVPNGMSWDLKKKVMYYNDTPYQTCTAYATDDEGVPIKWAPWNLGAPQRRACQAGAECRCIEYWGRLSQLHPACIGPAITAAGQLEGPLLLLLHKAWVLWFHRAQG